MRINDYPLFAFAKKVLLVAAICCMMAATGCGNSGPRRYDLSGTVTWNGKPVPRGYLVFTPDTAQGNSGPGTQVDVLEGKYQTMPGLGTIGGPHVVAVFAYDGVPYRDEGMMNPMGKPLILDKTMLLDLPKAIAERDIALME